MSEELTVKDAVNSAVNELEEAVHGRMENDNWDGTLPNFKAANEQLENVIITLEEEQ